MGSPLHRSCSPQRILLVPRCGFCEHGGLTSSMFCDLSLSHARWLPVRNGTFFFDVCHRQTWWLRGWSWNRQWERARGIRPDLAVVFEFGTPHADN